MITQRAELTFKGNLRLGRHSWLRLTPAYSVHVVRQLLDELDNPDRVLDPFSGTGTTGLVCAERGLTCDLLELNPFLTWLARIKTRNYTEAELATCWELAQAAATQVQGHANSERVWVPPIHHIERWWTPERLAMLAGLFHGLQSLRRKQQDAALDLALVAFCRVAIEWSNAAFNHQSMSFKEDTPTLFSTNEQDLIVDAFLANARQITASARPELPGQVNVYQGNSRRVADLAAGPYDCVITSPPYPNRMSYIRELRPYMYWLGYLNEAREAGDLDWEAIGGTWGVATSRLAQWTPDGVTVQHDGFYDLVRQIAASSPLLANYVHKYFVDMAAHLNSLSRVLVPGAKVFYVVGNSKFYDTLVPVERIYESLMAQCGFKYIKSDLLRKRNSKKELYEFVVSGEWVADASG
jgi:DNA modification methylase